MKKIFLKSRLFNTAWLLLLIFILNGCGCGKFKKKPNLSGIEVELEVRRFEQALFSIHPEELEEALPVLEERHPEFFPFFMDEMMGFGMERGDTIENLKKFISDLYVRELYDSCMAHYADMSNIEKDLTLALRYFKYYYPEKHIPKMVTFLSGFAYKALTFDTLVVGIGLDMFLGEDFKYYPSLYPEYIYSRFTREQMVPNVIKVLAGMYYEKPPESNLLERMIYEGKILYFLDLMLPDYADHVKMEYTPEQLQWCRDNEPEIWNFFIQNEWLFSTDLLQYSRFVNEAPSTSGMPVESPGRVGIWTGWQIVRKYMREHPQTSLHDLMANTDATTILNQSKYKPRKGWL